MMVRDYGMSSLGPEALGNDHGPSFLRSAGVPEIRSYSEQTARMIDEEVRKMVSEALDRAREVLNANRDKLQAVAARLLATEVIEEEAMVTILGPKVLAERGLLHPEARAVISAHPVGGTESETPPTQHTEKKFDA
jgi:cell division protease FtsH